MNLSSLHFCMASTVHTAMLSARATHEAAGGGGGGGGSGAGGASAGAGGSAGGGAGAAGASNLNPNLARSLLTLATAHVRSHYTHFRMSDF